MFWKIFLVLFFVGVNGFFVAAEFTLVKLRTSEIQLLQRTGKRSAKLVERIIERLDAYLSACQLGITLASLALGWIGEPFVARTMEPIFHYFAVSEKSIHIISFLIAFTIITSLHITVGEQVPKILAIQKYKTISLWIAFPLVIFYKVFKPFIWVLNTSSNAILRIIGIRSDTKHGGIPTEAELRHILFEASNVGYLKSRERLIMENVLDLEEKIARRYMVPRNQIVFINRDDSMEEKLKVVSESGHTRLPLCDGDLDHIVGIVHVKDLFQYLSTRQEIKALADIAREAVFLPETIRLDVLMVEFQKRKSIMAILIDEYGMVSGMITLENVLEELVGPIQDEFDDEKPGIVKKEADQYELDAACPIGDVERVCEIRIPEFVRADTIGGAVLDILGHIPQEGEKLTIGNHQVTITNAEPTRIKKLVINKIQTQERGI